MPKVDPARLPKYDGPDSAEPFAGSLGKYEGRAVSPAFGLRHLGISIETLEPGAASSHRHWHERTDEMVIVLDGVLTLVENGSTTTLERGDMAVFPAGVENGHCLQNRSGNPARFVVVGSRDATDVCHYADIDLVAHPGGRLTRRDGSPATP